MRENQCWIERCRFNVGEGRFSLAMETVGF